MNTKYLLFRIITFILLLTLLLTCMPAGQVAARPVSKLTVDVWTSKGGQGANMSGGQYNLGEQVVIYFTASIGCRVQVIWSGPGGSNSWEQSAMYGPTYQIPLGFAESVDIGQWQVVLNAITSTGDQTASDTTMFSIVGPAPTPYQPPVSIPSQPPAMTPTQPAEPEPEPEPVPQPEPEPQPQPASTVTRSNVTELDSLKALKMAEGALTQDLALDVDNDGTITREDAAFILKWVLENKVRLVLEHHVADVQMVAPDNINLPSVPITGIATPNGGAAIESDGMKLTIPPGAVSQNTEIVVKKFTESPLPPLPEQTISEPHLVVISEAYDFGPAGLEFQQPVTITLSYEENDLPHNVDEKYIRAAYFNGKAWVIIPGIRNTDSNTVSVKVSGFPGEALTLGVVLAGVTLLGWVTGELDAFYGWVKGDPVTNGNANEYVTPYNTTVQQYAEKVVIKNKGNTSFSNVQELRELLKSSGLDEGKGMLEMRFDINGKIKDPPYTDPADWLKPADYFNSGMTEGDCNDTACAYASVLRAKGINAKCVVGHTKRGGNYERHVWVEFEVDGKPYFIGDEGNIQPLAFAEKELLLERPEQKDEGFMWDETGMVRYQANWWESIDLSKFTACVIKTSLNCQYKDVSGQESRVGLVNNDLSQTIGFGSFKGNTFTGSYSEDMSKGNILRHECTITLDPSGSKIIEFEGTKEIVGAPHVLHFKITGGDIKRRKDLETQLGSATGAGYLYVIEGTEACSRITSFKSGSAGSGESRELISHECNANSYIQVIFLEQLALPK
jgi:hypothetical protein